MKVHLVSFSAGLPENALIVERLKKQAKACSYIDTITVISTPSQKLHKKFHQEFGNFIKNNPRGYGYWLWKPFILAELIKTFPQGDLILYCDIGCELSPSGEKRFWQYVDQIKQQGIVGFSTRNKQPEYFWCKAELLNYFNLPEEALLTEQVCATFFIAKVSNFSTSFFDEWFRLAKLKDFMYINDDCSSNQRKGFIEHRHDQSIFSLMMKRTKQPVLRTRSFFPPVMYYKNSLVYLYPIHSLRSKTKNYFIEPLKAGCHGFLPYQFVKYHVIFFCHRVKRKLFVLLGLV